VKQVLFVSMAGRIAGAEKSLLLLVKYLHAHFEPVVACPSKSPLAQKLTQMQIRCRDLPVSARPVRSRPAQLLTVACRLMKIIHELKPALIHANNFYAAVASLPAALLTGRKLICHARDMAQSAPASKLCARLCQRVIAVSNAVRNSLVAKGTNPDKINVVYNGVDIHQAACHTTKTRQVGHHARPTIFANIGQFVPWKKQTLFVDAARRLIEKGLNAEFLLAGDDIFQQNRKYKAELLSQISDSGMAEKISLLGWRENIDDLWERIDCLVHTADPEPFGRVIIEAMANSVPVIAVNSAGPAEVVHNDVTAIGVQPDNIDQLINAMVTIADDKELACRLASAARKTVLAKFSAQRTAISIKQIYDQVLAG
jgi:glycosyltransferase involved in cell wall biosynthesis